jgi:molybdate transport system ATP-binding protein
MSHAAAGLEVSLRRSFTGKKRQAFMLDVEFQAATGVTVIFGPSGAGKSTILQCLAGLLRPDSGMVSIGGETVFDSSRKIDIPAQLRRVGYLFQDLALFPHMTAAENIGFGIRVNGQEKVRRVEEMLERFHISRVAAHRPEEISGGERQRVALARALATEPRLLLLDEPFSALDDSLKRGIIADLKQWRDLTGVPALFVTHDRGEAEALGDRMLLLQEGKIVGAEEF